LGSVTDLISGVDFVFLPNITFHDTFIAADGEVLWITMRHTLRPDRAEKHNTTPESFSKDAAVVPDTYANDAPLSDSGSETGEKQAGVKRIEAISKSWTTVSLVVAYVS
jgi:hypothetical protein